MWIVNIPARNSATIKLITTRRRSPGLRDSPMRVRLAGCHVPADRRQRRARPGGLARGSLRRAVQS
jgi:hypothetical protein